MMMIKVMVTRMMVDDDGYLLAMMLTMTFFGIFRIYVTNLFSIASLKKNIYITKRYTCFLMPPMQVLDITLIYSCIHQIRQYYKFCFNL